MLTDITYAPYADSLDQDSGSYSLTIIVNVLTLVL